MTLEGPDGGHRLHVTFREISARRPDSRHGVRTLARRGPLPPPCRLGLRDPRPTTSRGPGPPTAADVSGRGSRGQEQRPRDLRIPGLDLEHFRPRHAVPSRARVRRRSTVPTEWTWASRGNFRRPAPPGPDEYHPVKNQVLSYGSLQGVWGVVNNCQKVEFSPLEPESWGSGWKTGELPRVLKAIFASLPRPVFSQLGPKRSISVSRPRLMGVNHGLDPSGGFAGSWTW